MVTHRFENCPEVRCFYKGCKQLGHIVKNCPLRIADQRAARAR